MHSMRFFITTILLMFATSVVANPLLEKRCIDHGPCNSAVECCSRYCYNYVSQRAIFQINVRALNNPICFARVATDNFSVGTEESRKTRAYTCRMSFEFCVLFSNVDYSRWTFMILPFGLLSTCAHRQILFSCGFNSTPSSSSCTHIGLWIVTYVLSIVLSGHLRCCHFPCNNWGELYPSSVLFIYLLIV